MIQNVFDMYFFTCIPTTTLNFPNIKRRWMTELAFQDLRQKVKQVNSELQAMVEAKRLTSAEKSDCLDRYDQKSWNVTVGRSWFVALGEFWWFHFRARKDVEICWEIWWTSLAMWQRLKRFRSSWSAKSHKHRKSWQKPRSLWNRYQMLSCSRMPTVVSLS